MVLALASRWLEGGAARLADATEAARRLGFAQVFASAPPRDVERAKGVLATTGVALAGVAAAVATDAPALAGVVLGAAEPAARLRRPLVVVDLGAAVVGRRETAEDAVLRWSRAVHAAVGAWSGLAIALRPTGTKGHLFGFQEVAWLLEDLASKPIGLHLDPARALALHRAGAGPEPLAWADRFAARTLGVAVHGLGPAGAGHARPEDDGPDWGTLSTLVPARAARVLDVDPAVGADEVADARRHLEEVLHW